MRVERRRFAQTRGASGGDRAAQFAGEEKLSITNDGTFNPPGNTDLHLGYWFCLDDLPESGVYEMVNTTGGVITADCWFTFVAASDGWFRMGCTDGSGYTDLPVEHVIQVGQWYYAGCWWDNSGVEANLTLTLWDTSDLLGSVTTAGRFLRQGNPQPVNIGGGIDGQQWTVGRFDKVGIWTRAAGSPVDLTAAWNNGFGLTGEQVQAHGTLAAGLLAYYDLDEDTGAATWPDATGDHDATATGTVVSVPRAGFL